MIGPGLLVTTPPVELNPDHTYIEVRIVKSGKT